MARSEHVLVVEDNDAVREILIETLEGYGYRASGADGGEAMRRILDSGDPVDIVVLDALTPGETSESLALLAKKRHFPVVMISGSPRQMEFAQKLGLQLLWKPFKGAELIEAIKNAVASKSFGQRDA